MRRVPSAGVVVALVIASVAVGARPAVACSCASAAARSMLEAADAAFVGRLESRHPGSGRDARGSDEATYRFRVVQVAKGQLGETVDVVSARDGAGCGFEVPVGVEAGVFLRRREDGRWTGGLCSTTTADRLRAALEPMAPVDGTSPPMLLLGTEYGDASVVGLDARGRVSGYVRDRGRASHFSVCPGGGRVAVSGTTRRVGADHPAYVATMDLRSMATIEEVIVPEASSSTRSQRYVTSLACRRADGGDVLLASVEGADDRVGMVLRVVDGEREVVWRGPALAVTLSTRRNVAFVITTNGSRRTLGELDLATGRTRNLLTTDRLGEWVTCPVVNKQETLAASFHYGGRGGAPGGIVLFDLRDEPATARTAPLGGTHGGNPTLAWIGDERLLSVPGYGDPDTARIYDAQLHEIDSWPEYGRAAAVDGRSLVVARTDSGGATTVEIVDLATKRRRTLRTLEDVDIFEFAFVDGGPPEVAPLPRGTTNLHVPMRTYEETVLDGSPPLAASSVQAGSTTTPAQASVVWEAVAAAVLAIAVGLLAVVGARSWRRDRTLPRQTPGAARG